MINIEDSATTLRTLRRERGLTQIELSRRSRVHPSTISRAESARYVLSRVEARRLARALGVRVQDLFQSDEFGKTDA